MKKIDKKVGGHELKVESKIQIKVFSVFNYDNQIGYISLFATRFERKQ